MKPSFGLSVFKWRSPDWILLISILLLCVISLLILYSASGQDLNLVIKQSIRISAGLTALFVMSQMPITLIKNWAPWIFLLSLSLLFIVLIAGVDSKGATRWLSLGVVRFQPSELMKIALPIMLSWHLRNIIQPLGLKDFISSGVIIMIAAGLIYKQPDLGTALLVSASGVFVLFLSGLSWKIILGCFGSGFAALPVLWHFLHEYQKNRVRTFLNPENDPLGTGWNIIQSKIAIGSGGLYGKGWHQGTQSRLEFLPEKQTDFILAVLSEEFGFLGVIVLLLLYGIVIYRGLMIALNAQKAFNRLLAGSLTLTFFVYVIVNMGMVSGLLPVVGVPLPLISYGGTSILTLMAGFGLIMSINQEKGFLQR